MPSDAAPSDRDVLADCKDSGRDTRAACRGGDTAAALFDPAATPYLEEEKLRRTHLVPRHLTKDNTALTKALWGSSGTSLQLKGPHFHLCISQSCHPRKSPVTFSQSWEQVWERHFSCSALGVCFICLASVPSGWLLAVVDGGFYFPGWLYPS